LAVQLTAYRPRIRYVYYTAVDYSGVYDSMGYVRPTIYYTSYEGLYDKIDYSKSISPLLAVQLTAYRPRIRYASFSTSELYAPFESAAVKTAPVYGAGSYEVLYEPVYRPTVRYYNVYFVNVYRYANVYDLERLYESAAATRSRGVFSSFERLYEQAAVLKRGYGYASYERLYEGFAVLKRSYESRSYERLYEGFIAQKR
jgi:hypothetical protein